MKGTETKKVDELVDYACSRGAICIQRKEKIRNYKNGAKIAVSRVYIKNRLVEIDKSYTVLLIKED